MTNRKTKYLLLAIDNQDFDKFLSSLKEVLSFIKYAKDEIKLQELLDANKAFHHLGTDEVNVLNECTNAKIKKGEEVIDVYLAIEQMKAAQKERIFSLFAYIKNLMENGWNLSFRGEFHPF